MIYLIMIDLKLPVTWREIHRNWVPGGLKDDLRLSQSFGPRNQPNHHNCPGVPPISDKPFRLPKSSLNPREHIAPCPHSCQNKMSSSILIPARGGTAVHVKAGQTIKVINTHGDQVVDTWAFSTADPKEFMSMEHTRPTILRITPKVGDSMLTNKRRPILTILEDTSGGVHDTVIAACDRYRYELLGCEGYHDNCTDNLYKGMKDLGLEPPEVPSPLNLFMNIPVKPDRSLSFDPPVSTPGSYVLFRAEMDLVVAFSACPQDVLPINGVGHLPTEAHFLVK